MQHKIFIGVRLPDTIKKRLLQVVRKWADLPVKWVPEENLHATLLFLGYVNEESVAEMCEKVSAAAREEQGFDILFENIALAPDADDPRMVWLRGAESEEMKALAGKLEQVLLGKAAPKKHFRPHVTLGRLRHEKWAVLEEKPVIDQRFSATIPVEAVDIFESVMDNGKSKFIVLESCPLS